MRVIFTFHNSRAALQSIRHVKGYESALEASFI